VNYVSWHLLILLKSHTNNLFSLNVQKHKEETNFCLIQTLLILKKKSSYKVVQLLLKSSQEVVDYILKVVDPFLVVSELGDGAVSGQPSGVWCGLYSF
jgi:hypothetical protein